jgi:hypothetical protein
MSGRALLQAKTVIKWFWLFTCVSFFDFFSGADPDEEQEEEDEEEEESSDESDGEKGGSGMYNPSDYAHLDVSSEIKDLFQYIQRYKPQKIDLETRLKPFIPGNAPPPPPMCSLFTQPFWCLLQTLFRPSATSTRSLKFPDPTAKMVPPPPLLPLPLQLHICYIEVTRELQTLSAWPCLTSLLPIKQTRQARSMLRALKKLPLSYATLQSSICSCAPYWSRGQPHPDSHLPPSHTSNSNMQPVAVSSVENASQQVCAVLPISIVSLFWLMAHFGFCSQRKSPTGSRQSTTSTARSRPPMSNTRAACRIYKRWCKVVPLNPISVLQISFPHCWAVWPAEVEECIAGEVLPNAELDLDVSAFGRVCCAMLDIPVHQSLKESLHVFFTL